MSIFIIYTPFLFIFFTLSIININYYSHWQFIPAKWVWKWPTSGFRMSPDATSQVPVGISLLRQKNFARKYNCQIRHNKLHYKIISSYQTPERNLNSSQITKNFPIRKRIMSIFIIFRPFLFNFFMFSIINNNYYSHWQFIPAKWVWKWPRSGFRMSPIATTQVPVGISLSRQKIFAWKYNCQIRHIKLHYTIIFLRKILQGI